MPCVSKLWEDNTGNQNLVNSKGPHMYSRKNTSALNITGFAK